MPRFRIERLLKEIELLLHASNESIELAIKYRPVIIYKIKLISRYKAEVM